MIIRYLLIIYLVNLCFSIKLIFFDNRESKSTIIWLLVINILPAAGYILFFMFGNSCKHKNESGKKINIERQKSEMVKKNAVCGEDKEEIAQLIMYNLNACSAKYSSDNSVKIFTDGKCKFGDMIKCMKNAQQYIHIQYYIIKDDELFDTIKEMIIRKSEQGVEVRLLVDGMGTRFLKKTTIDELKDKGIEVGVFQPSLIWKINIRFNHRNHRKIVIVDDTAYVGGFNIGNEYIGKDKRFGYWRDTHMRIRGHAVDELQNIFLSDWKRDTGEEISNKNKYYYGDNMHYGHIGLQIISGGPGMDIHSIRDNYIRMMYGAKKNIYIQTPYFIPGDSVFEAIRNCALSGIDVKIMIPCRPDHPFVYWATVSYAGELLKYGVKVYLYMGGFLHAKGMMIDGMVSTYGTANVDERSFELNYEVNTVIYDDKTTKMLEAVFFEDMQKCEQMGMYTYAKRSIKVRIKEQIARLISPLL